MPQEEAEPEEEETVTQATLAKDSDSEEATPVENKSDEKEEDNSE